MVIVTYGRDAFHRHVIDTVGSTVTDRFFSSDWQLLETKTGSNTVTRNVWSPVYVDGLVLRDRDTDANGTLDERLYSLQDANWNTTAVVNTSGTVQERYTYTPFGQVTFRDSSGSTLSSSAKDWVFLHQGGEKIAAGDYEFRNRLCSPTLGRWLSNDPLGFEAGDQNWYWAIGNNPGNGLDALGLTDAPFKPNDDGSRPDNAGIGGFGVQRPSRPSQYIPSRGIGDWMYEYTNWYDQKLGYTGSVLTYGAAGIVVGGLTVAAFPYAASLYTAAAPYLTGTIGAGLMLVGAEAPTALAVAGVATTYGPVAIGAAGIGIAGYEGISATVNGDWETVAFMGGGIVGGLAAGGLSGFISPGRLNPGKSSGPISPLGKGSTINSSIGRYPPRNLREKLAIDEGMQNPEAGIEDAGPLNDMRWPAKQGWKKYQQTIYLRGREGPI